MTTTEISDNRAWSLCGKIGKAAPYAGYAIETPKGRVICRRDESTGHKAKFFLIEPGRTLDGIGCDMGLGGSSHGA